MSYVKCPICREDYFNLKHPKDRCTRHSIWIITVCSVCGKECFSPVSKKCPDCLKKPWKQ